MGFIKKLKRNFLIAWHSLFHGMAGADAVMNGPKDALGGTEINQQVKPGGVFADMLEEKQTQAVIEMRDKSYRVLKEADKYDTSGIKMTVDENGEVEFSGIDTVKKKIKEDFMKHSPVYEEEGYTLRTIQDNKHFLKHNLIQGQFDKELDLSLLPSDEHDYDTTLTVFRNKDFTPRFKLEKYATKMVVRTNLKNSRAMVDLYLPTVAGQFSKTDAIFISNIYRIWESKDTRSDITDVTGFEWYSDKGWNTDDVCLFKYNDAKFVGINIFDGSFVMSFDCNVLNDGTYLAEKFKTKELDEKYAKKASKKDSVDLFAAVRKEQKEESKEIDVNNLIDTILTNLK